MGIYHSHQLAFAGAVQSLNVARLEDSRSLLPAWLRSIPPERVGLHGEYDYYGLRKRVEAAFARQFPPETLVHLQVDQRGRVVILHGRVPSEAVLRSLVSIAEQVDGTIRVESAWVACGNGVALMVG